MATLLNHLGHYAPQVSQQQILGSSSSYAAPHMTSQSLIPRIPDTGYGASQAYPQTTSLYPASVKNDSLKAPPPLGQHYYVDHMMNPHPYSSLYHGLDLNSIRRKNATRETTGPLKNWLKTHRKNPYPTKGEKVMLAIATRMTLTQVSTWFANARRRMKKDKVDDDNDDDQESLPDTKQTDTRERSGSLSSSVSHYSTSEGDTSKDLSDISDIDVDDSINKKRHAKKCVQRLFSPDPRPDPLMDPSSSPESIISDRLAMPETTESRLPSLSEVMPNFMAGSKYLEQRVGTVGTVGAVGAAGTITSHVHSDTISQAQKPKIWSISEIIGSASSTLNTDNTSTVPYSYSNTPYSDYFSTSNTNYDYSVFNVNNYAAYAQQNYEHLQQSQSSVQYL